MREAAATAKEAAAGLDVQTHVAVTTAASLLEQESETAALVVVGARGRGGFAGLLLGSVAVALSASSRCPVVVVRGEEPVSGRPVAVGVHGAPEDWLVLDRAFEEAAARDTSLVAVHAWNPPFETAELAESVGIVWSALDAVRESLVAQRLASCADRHFGVRVRSHVLHGSAAQRLAEFSEHAVLLVIGSRGDAGSTGYAAVQHARCSVLLVRPGLAEQMARADRAV
jgi:nucleotide-binding universal stress UspA family protein